MTLLRVAIVLLVGLGGGCAWRSGGAEHYLGPVMFRHTAGAGGEAVVSQVRSLGLLAEGGRQWGLTLGMLDRITVAPRTAPGPVWTALGVGPLVPERWHLSLAYLRGIGVPAAPLVVRRLYGAQLAAGVEATALSVGVIVRADMRPPDDAVTLLEFDAASPLRARLTVWPAAEAAVRATEILEEARR
jgi:hypothetical protein